MFHLPDGDGACEVDETGEESEAAECAPGSAAAPGTALLAAHLAQGGSVPEAPQARLPMSIDLTSTLGFGPAKQVFRSTRSDPLAGHKIKNESEEEEVSVAAAAAAGSAAPVA